MGIRVRLTGHFAGRAARYSPDVDIVLIGGLWLTADVWDDVVDELAMLGHRGIPVALPGQGVGSVQATLEDQVAAVLAAVDASAGRPLVVGHSAAVTLAWLAADARPHHVAGLVFVGGFPKRDGEVYADYFEVTDGVMAFPGWQPFEGADIADLDEAARHRISGAAVPVPVGVSRALVRLHDEARYDVPAVLLCPEFSPAQAQEWIATGELPEVTAIRHLDLVDLDSGHWPMVSRPREIAAALAEVAARL